MKNITKKVLIGMTLVVIGTSAFLGITNSKYTNKITGSGETEIAKWNFVVNDSTEQMQTIKLADTYNQETLINGRIAPGTSGTFDLVLDASGAEVGVKYKVDFDNETNKPSNLKFKYNDKVFDEIEDYEDVFTGIIDADDTNKTRTLTVDWIWNYETQDNGNTLEENDKTDTLEGLDALDYSFDITVTGTQVIPTQNN
ncbi:MAG: hypothetical protein K1W33_00685 [Clostridia bacterium]